VILPAEIRVGGRRLRGWKSIEVSMGLRALATEFRAEVHDIWQGEASQAPPLALRGSPCDVFLDGELVLTGFLEDVELALSATDRCVRVGGRSRTGDLVDCSVPPGRSEFLGLRLEALARTLCEPHDVDVGVLCDTGAPLPSFRVQPGETVFEALARAARLRGVQLATAPSGALVLRRGTARERPQRVVEGESLRALALRAGSERYHEYQVIGGRGNALDGSWDIGSPIVETARDPGVRRRRLRVIHDAGLTTAAAARARAAYEAAMSLGRSVDARVQVRGWRANGELWTLGAPVRLVVPSFDLDETLAVVAVRFALGPEGLVTDLELSHLAALTPEPVVEALRSTGETW
jgi:prophage tail gpP-like protein